MSLLLPTMVEGGGCEVMVDSGVVGVVAVGSWRKKEREELS